MGPEGDVDAGDQQRNKALFDALETHRAELVSLADGLIWERLDNRRASRLATVVVHVAHGSTYPWPWMVNRRPPAATGSGSGSCIDIGNGWQQHTH